MYWKKDCIFLSNVPESTVCGGIRYYGEFMARITASSTSTVLFVPGVQASGVRNREESRRACLFLIILAGARTGERKSHKYINTKMSARSAERPRASLFSFPAFALGFLFSFSLSPFLFSFLSFFQIKSIGAFY